MKRITEIAICAALFAGIATAGMAQGGDPVAQRQAAMKGFGATIGAINAAVGTSDYATASAKAKELSASVKSLNMMFPAGTSAADGKPTGAKPEVWSNAAGFKAAVDKAGADADALVAAADSKDGAAVTAAVAGFRANCGTCHTAFRGPKPAA